MDSDALNTFLIVHRRGGISNAAKALHRSQPAISRRIALLEQELGVPLFERVAGRTRLSDAGRVMLPYAERAVAAAQDAENAVRALKQQNSGPVSVAVVGTLAGGLLSRILKRFAGEHPDVGLTLRTATSAEVSDLVRRGDWSEVRAANGERPWHDLDGRDEYHRGQCECGLFSFHHGLAAAFLSCLDDERELIFTVIRAAAPDRQRQSSELKRLPAGSMISRKSCRRRTAIRASC